jgi:putative addiction module component (TIGR02574 family)
MATAVPNPPQGFDDLSVEEKIDYLQSLWDRVAATPEKIPVPAWHLRVLDERLQAYHVEPERGKAWEKVRESLQRRFRRGKSSK